MQGKILLSILSMAALFSMKCAWASVTIPMYLVDSQGQGKGIGSIKAERSTCGVLLTPNLHDLPPGIHGFHIHEKATCSDNGMAAGSHLDPSHTGEHNGPYAKAGHLGDLPVLVVNADGTSTLPILAPKFKLNDLIGHTLMIHAGADNYSDKPEKLGGGGARIACGIISQPNLNLQA